MRFKRTLTVATVAGTVLMGGAAAAVAVSTGGGEQDLSTTGVSFKPGYYYFNAPSVSQGAFEIYGDLNDTAADGNAVFVHAKVEGYSYGTRVYNSGGAGTSKYVDRYYYAPDETYVTSGQYQACQDRGTLYSDLCATSSVKYRP